MTTFDDNTNPDLPGEIHEWTEDLADRQYHDQLHNQTFPCGFYQDRWWNWNDDVIGPNADEPVAGDEDWREWDGEEDDSWDDGDSLASCGWGEDEAYGFFGEDC